MPALPTVLARSAGGVVAVPNVQVTNGAIAGGLASAAESTGRLAASFEQQKEKDARLSTSLADAQLQIKLSKLAMERESSGDPLDNYASWLESATGAAYDEIIAGAKNDYEKTYLTMAKSDGIGRAVNRGLDVQEKYVVGKRASDLDTLFGDLLIAATLDPPSSPTHAATFRDALNAVDLPFEVRDKFKDAERKINAAGVAAMIEQNPYAGAGMAEDYLKRGMLDAESALTLRNRAEAGIKSREAEAKQRANEAKAAQAEAARIALEGADDALAFVAAGNNPTPEILNNYSPERIYALTGSEKAAKKAADAFARGEGVRELLNAGTPAERAKVIEDWRAKAADPENYQFNQDTLRILESGAADLNDKLVKDPGGVAQMSTRVQDAIKTGSGVNIVAASYAEQERQGIPDFQRKPLSNAYAVRVADQIASLPPDQQAGAMQELAKSYGSYWPDVLRQIGDKLPSGLAIAAVMPPGRAATRVAETAGLKMDEVMVGLDKDASRNIDDAITNDERFSNLASVLGSQVGGQKTLSQYSDAIKRSAAIIMRETGASEADAVAQATADMTADIDFRAVGQSIVAIPTASNPDKVEAGLDALTANFDLTGVDLPPSASGMNEADVKAAYASSIRRNGQWVPDGSGKGVYLYVEGDPVTRGGAPVLFTWDELKAAGLPKDGFMFEGQR